VLLDSETLGALFRDFKHSAFRLETHQTYTMPAETANVARFLRGEPKPADHNKAWHESIRANLAAGKTMQRVKLVHRPLTDYTRCLFAWAIPGNTAAGEDYRIVDVTDHAVDLPEQDFWLFDGHTVALLNFNPDGTLRDRDLVEGADVSQYLHWRDVALSESVPFSEYRA
jgi:hypothetical protein